MAVNSMLLCRLVFGGMRLVVIIGRMVRQKLLRMVLGLVVVVGCRWSSLRDEGGRVGLTFYILLRGGRRFSSLI